MSGQLPLSAEPFAALLTVVLLLCKVEPQVVLHSQAVWVGGVADIAVVVSDFVEVLVVGEAPRVTVRLPTLLTGERPATALSRIELLRSRGTGRGVRLLKALRVVLDPHDLRLCGVCSECLELRGARLLEPRSVGACPNQTFGPVLLVEPQVVYQLLLDLKGLATFFTLVPL